MEKMFKILPGMGSQFGLSVIQPETLCKQRQPVRHSKSTSSLTLEVKKTVLKY